MWFLGKNRGYELVKKIKDLQKFKTVKDDFDQLYGILDILDSKATGLLTVDTLLIAVFAFLLPSYDSVEKAVASTSLPFLVPTHLQGVSMIQLVLASLSALLCLLVDSVSWKFMQNVPVKAGKEADFEKELHRLANVIDDRTHYYWVAWWLAFFTFVSTLAWWSPWFALAAFILVALRKTIRYFWRD